MGSARNDENNGAATMKKRLDLDMVGWESIPIPIAIPTPKPEAEPQNGRTSRWRRPA